MKALIFQNDERQNHLEHIIWKTLIFESRKPDRKSRIEGERREGNNNAFNEEKTSLVPNGIAYSEALARVRWVPSLFFPFFFFSISFFFCLEFSLERATLTFHHLRHPRWHKVIEEDVSGFLARKDPLLLLSYRSSILFVSPIPMQETVSNSANKASPSPRFPNLLYPLYSVYSYCCSCSLGFIMSNDIRQ